MLYRAIIAFAIIPRMDVILFFQSARDKSWRDKLAGVYRFAREHDWLVQVIDRDTPPRDIRRLLDKWKPIGCLVDRARATAAAPDKTFGPLPVVYHDQNPSHASAIHPNLLQDSSACTKIASDELLSLGLPNYAYAPSAERYFWCTERHNCFRATVRKAGKRFFELNPANFTDSLSGIPKPCGVLAANDRVALDIFQAAKAVGLSIPDDIAIVGIDNDEIICEAVTPGITSVQPDFESAGYHLAEMLAAEMANAGKPRRGKAHTEFYRPLRIVRRGSTRILAKTDPRVSRALEFLRRNACRTSLRVDEVVAVMRCSRRLATMRFREVTGHSIVDEIKELRFLRTCELLSANRMRISEIVTACGYRSESFLKKTFRQRTGFSMREWKKASAKFSAQFQSTAERPCCSVRRT